MLWKKEWLAAEAQQKQMIGWDFSAIANEYWQEDTPWSYQEIVKSYLQPQMQLLDMGTGGGELLATFQHPTKNTSVTEGWGKNYNFLLESLAPQGVNVQFVKEDDLLNFSDDSFDIVINSHESFDLMEVKRVLKSQGYFITQQVGDLNGRSLASHLIPNFVERTDLNLEFVKKALQKLNFKILFGDESYPQQKFFTMPAVIYYALSIPWEFPDFSVKNNYQQLLRLHAEIAEKGFIENRQHRFVIVAQKK